MIVPAGRLLWLTALAVVPLVTLAVMLPGGFLAFGGAAVLIAALAWFDLGRAREGLEGVSVDLPDVVRVSKGNDFVIEIKVRNRGRRCRALSAGLAFGESLAAERPILDMLLPLDSEFARHEWKVVALKRGCYRFDACYLETKSPFGLWEFRDRRPVACEVRVYPNLLLERKSLAALFLHRGEIGIHAQRQVGKGRDFEQLREYLPGDDYGDIFWKASAKRGFPMTKIFQLERTQELYVVVDHSRLSAREIRLPVETEEGPGPNEYIGGGDVEVTTQLERFLHAALVMGLVAEQQGDLFGLITFARQVDGFIRSRNGKAHFDVCRDALYTLETERVTPDYEELVVFIRKHLTRRALLVILTDLSDPLLAEGYLESMRLISRQHMVITVMLKPERAEPLFAHGEVEGVEDIYGQLAGHFLWAELEQINRSLGQQGVHFSVPEHEALSTEMVTQYLSIKRRQLL